MAYNVQQQVDAYETMGLGALQNMQQKNPKLLVGIALENLQKDMQEQQRAKQMASGAVGPQQAMATAAPGLQMRGQQMQAAQMRKAMAPQAQPMRMAGGGIIGFSQGGTNQSQSPRPTPDGQPTAAAQDAAMADINNYIQQYKDYQASNSKLWLQQHRVYKCVGSKCKRLKCVKQWHLKHSQCVWQVEV
jgi:hypothetical protein